MPVASGRVVLRASYASCTRAATEDRTLSFTFIHVWRSGNSRITKCQGSANTNRLFPALGRSSGVSPVKCDDVPPEPVLTATNWRPSTA